MLLTRKNYLLKIETQKEDFRVSNIIIVKNIQFKYKLLKQ